MPWARNCTPLSLCASSSNTSTNSAADDLALLLRVADARERREEARLGVDADDAHAQVLRERAHHLVALAQAQQAVIDEHAHQLLADRPVQQRGDHRGIDAAGESQQHLALAHLGAHARDRILDDVADAPQRIAAADLAHEALQQLRPLRGVRHLRVKLHPVEAAPLIAHGGVGDGGGAGVGAEAGRQRGHAVAVAHPHIEQRLPGGVAPVGEVLEQPRGGGDGHFGVTEFALARGRHAAAELLRHGLHAVADAEHRHAEFEHRLRRARGICGGHRLGAAGEDDPAGLKGAHLRRR